MCVSQDSKLKCNPGSLICRALSTWSALGPDQLLSFLLEAVGLVSWVLLDLRSCSLMVRVRAVGQGGVDCGSGRMEGMGMDPELPTTSLLSVTAHFREAHKLGSRRDPMGAETMVFQALTWCRGMVVRK